GAGFAWVHHGLRRVLEERDDAFLARTAAGLMECVTDRGAGGGSDLEATVRREGSAHEPGGPMVVGREPGPGSVAPRAGAALRLADRPAPPGPPRTIDLPGAAGRYRVLVAAPRAGGMSIELGITFAETDATLAAFDRTVAGGALVFLALAVVGGAFLSRQ